MASRRVCSSGKLVRRERCLRDRGPSQNSHIVLDASIRDGWFFPESSGASRIEVQEPNEIIEMRERKKYVECRYHIGVRTEQESRNFRAREKQ